MMTLLFAVISVTLLGLWAARALTAPLSSFAKAAENFSLNGAAAPLPERGPEEIRSVAKALNRMRERITGLIDDRTKMLAAISHDLRTPITRMRLRSEFIEDDAQRSRMLDDLDQMRSMLESVLSFLRNDRKLESMTLVDIASTLQLITDQFGDMGHKVTYDGPDHAMATVRPDDLHRSVTNLVENAVRFGAEATIRLRVAADRLTIDVEDDGPGISDAQKKNVLEPFVRGDDARNMDEAVGLRPRPFHRQRHRARAWRRAVAARPATAWTNRSDSIAGSAEPALGGVRPRRFREHGVSARSGYRFTSRKRSIRKEIRPLANPGALLRRSQPPRSDSHRRDRTRETTSCLRCSQPSPVSQSACRIARTDFHEANSRNPIGPWRILPVDLYIWILNWTALLSEPSLS